MSKIRSRDRRLYNKDLAPTDKKKRIGVGLKSLTFGQMMFRVYLVILWQRRCF